jgi:DNA-binding CsgD family transcriptional regulator
MTLGFAGRPGEAMAAAATARRQLTGRGHRVALPELEAQLACLHQLAGNREEAMACCERGLTLLGEPWPDERGEPRAGEPARDAAGRERWISGYLYLIAGLALAGCPGRERAAAAALHRALAAEHALGDVLGTAYAVEALAWLAAQRDQGERTAWLLGAADQLWAVTGRRLSGIAVLEDSRQQAMAAARAAIGGRRYTAAYRRGAALDLDAAVREALDDAGALPARPPGRPAGDPAASGALAAMALLSRREREIAGLVASGLSNREIGVRLFISKRTVDAHVEHIFGKLEISSRVQLTVMLREAPRLARGAGD